MTQSRARLLLLLLIGLLLLATYRGWPSADGAYFQAEAETMLDQGHLGRDQIGAHEAAFYTKASDGRFYGQSNEGAMIVTLTPFVLLGRGVAAIVPAAYEALAPPFACGLHSLLFTLLAAWLLLHVTRAMGMSERTAFWSALLFVLSTPLLHYAGRLFRDPLVVAAQLWVCLCLLNWLNHASWRRSLWLALALAVLAWVRLPNGALMALVTLLMAFGQWRRAGLGVLLAALGLALALGLRWLWMQAALGPIELGGAQAGDGANASLIADKIFLNINGSEGLSAAGDAEAATHHWWVPLARMLGMVISPGAGLLFYAPLVLIGAGVIWRRRDAQHQPARLAWLMLIYTILGYGLYAAWFSGSWGVRYLLPAMALPLVFAVDWLLMLERSKFLRGGIFLLAMAIGLLGTVVNDRPSVAGAPSEDASVTRRDQVWQIAAFPLYHHARRALAAEWTPIDRASLAQGHTSAKREVLAGYVVWWAVAMRAGMTWLVIFPLAILAATIAIILLLVRRPKEAILAPPD